MKVMTRETNAITAFLEKLAKTQLPSPSKRRERFLHLYRQIEGVVDMNSLSEAEYEKLFNGLSAACGFDDPMDALEALADRKAKTP
jgi:hypothetical protein